MEKRLHHLETIDARGNDGKHYVVHGYEHLARLQGATDFVDQWEPIGLAEYKLSDGGRIDIEADGAMRIAATGVKLTRESGVRSR